MSNTHVLISDLQLMLQPLNGRSIQVSFANDKPRNSFGDRSGGWGGSGDAGF